MGLNLYTLSMENLLLSSPICLLSKASKTKSWLWHQRLSHLSFNYITSLAKKGLVRGLPKLKYQNDHLCSAYALGKSKKHSYKPKAEDSIQETLYVLHMDLCEPMRIQNLGKLKPKADIGIFIGYAPTKKAFRIYNKRACLIIETIHVYFDELTAMASEQFSSGPMPKLLTPRTISSRLVQNIHSSTLRVCRPIESQPYVQASESSLQVKAGTKGLSPIGIILNQSKYAIESLKKYGMKTYNPVDTPMVEKSKLDEDPQGKAVDPTCYRGMIGTLMYLTSTFTDANHAGCQDTRKSTSGRMQILGDGLVGWSSKKQKSTAISSTEAEYITFSGCCAQILWMRS
ncbi:retrovirus-related pol polyprotein from transposon TNT 1-94 [Tanacetum coccineum]